MTVEGYSVDCYVGNAALCFSIGALSAIVRGFSVGEIGQIFAIGAVAKKALHQYIDRRYPKGRLDLKCVADISCSIAVTVALYSIGFFSPSWVILGVLGTFVGAGTSYVRSTAEASVPEKPVAEGRPVQSSNRDVFSNVNL